MSSSAPVARATPLIAPSAVGCHIFTPTASSKIHTSSSAASCGWPPRLNAFTIYDFVDTSEQLVVVETFAAELYHDDPGDVGFYAEVFDALAAAALFDQDAAELIRASL